MATAKNVTLDLAIDLNLWTMKDLTAFTTAVSANDYEAAAPIAAKAITAWPFEGAVGDVATWEKLSIVSVAAVLKTVRKAVEQVFAEGN